MASYLGLIPAEASSGGRQRLGHITKQGNVLLRGLLVEAAHSAVAVTRKLAVRLGWMWKRGLDDGQWRESGSHAGSARFSRWGEVDPRFSE